MMNVLLRTRHSFFLFAVLLVWSIGLSDAALGQTITVENGGEIEMRNGGVWDLEGTRVDLGGVGATVSIDETGGGRFDDGQLEATRTLTTPSQANPAGLGLEISSGEDLGETTITRDHTVQTGDGNSSISRYFDIAPTNNSNLHATLTFTYADAELNGLSENELVFFRSTDGGTTWSGKGMDGRDASTNRATLNGIDAFSRWTLASKEQPLPVELVEFNAQTGDSDEVRLTWKTVSEENNAEFRIQRRPSDAEDWTTLGQRDGAGTTTVAQSYRFEDADVPYAADSLHYRLKQIDLDGTTHLSDPVTVVRNAVTNLTLHPPHPNPVSNRATVRYAVPPETDEATLRVYDVLGRVVQTAATNGREGRQEIQLDVADLASGVYVLRLRAGDSAKTERFSVVK